MRITHRTAIVLSGLLWFGIGIFLLLKGLHFIVAAAHPEQLGSSSVLLPKIAHLAGGMEKGALFLISIALLLGFIKGRWVLVRSVKRGVKHILSQAAPLRLNQVYPKNYFLLIAVMMGLGLLMRISGLADDLRGLVDAAVGSALINGAFIYFRCALTLEKAK